MAAPTKFIFALLLPILFLTADAPAQIKMTRVDTPFSRFGQTLASIDLHQHVFLRYFNLANTKIFNNTDLSICQFYGTADFAAAHFSGTADFGNTDFYRLGLFLRDTFSQEARFLGVNFRDEGNFEGAYFKNEAHFVGDSFLLRTVFLHTEFLKFADFNASYFKGRCLFNNSVFHGDISFNGSFLPGEMDFSSTVFLGNLDFSNITNVGSRIDLTVARTDTGQGYPKPRRGINLTNSDISRFKLDYTRFYLVFDDSASFEYRSNVYQSLLNNFKNDGYTESHELLDKEYRTFQYNHKGNHFLRWLDEHWWDFGYSKNYIFIWIFLFVAFFTLLNFFLYPFLNKEVYTVNDVKGDYPFRKWKKLPSRLYYALVYTSVLFFSLSVKLENLQYRRWYGVLYIFIIYLLGIVCLAYTANFILQK